MRLLERIGKLLAQLAFVVVVCAVLGEYCYVILAVILAVVFILKIIFMKS